MAESDWVDFPVPAAHAQGDGQPIAPEFNLLRTAVLGVRARAALSAASARNALTGWFHATGFGALGDGTTNDAAAIQAAIDAANAAGGGVVYLQATGAANNAATIYAINTTLIIRSGVELRLGVAVTLTRGSTLKSSIIRNAASYPTTFASAATIIAASTTLTVTGASFTSADVGKSIVITGAGPTYTGGSPHQATISSVTNGTTVVLSAAASTSVSNASVRMYTRDKDIAITGEIGAQLLLGASGQQNNLSAIPVYLRNVDRARIAARDGLMFVQTTDSEGGGKYALDLYACNNWQVEGIRFDTGSDGVHIVGKSSNFRVRDIYGSTGDDSVAIVGNERLTSTNTDGDLGDVSGFVIENIQTTAGAGTNGVKLLPCRAAGASVGFTINRGTIRNVSGTHGSNSNTGSAVVIGAANEQSAESVYALGQVDNILVDSATSTNQPGVSIFNVARARNITLSRVKNVRVANRAVVEDLTIRDSHFNLAAGEYAINLTPGGGTVGVYGPQVGTLRIQNCRLTVATASGGLVNATGDGTALGILTVDSYTCTQAAWALGQFSTATDIYGTGLSLTANNVAAISGTGVLKIKSLSQSTSLSTYGKYDSGTIRAGAFSVLADVSTLTASANDMATNTNASLACGAGPVATDGSGWRNVATNALYAFSAPGAVQNFTATAGTGQNTLVWAAPASDGGAALTFYRVWRSTSSTVDTSGTPLYTTPDAATVSYVDSSVTGGTTYYYVVKPVNKIGNGTASSTQSATPAAGSSNARPASSPTLTTQPFAWIRADKVTVSGSNVTAAQDQSSNGYNAIVPSGATGPTVTGNAVNGQPTLTFTNGQKLVIPAPHSTENITALIVFRVADITASRFIAADSTTDGSTKVDTGLNIYTANTNKQLGAQVAKVPSGSYGSASSATNSVPGGTFLIGRVSVGAATGHSTRVGINGTLGTTSTPSAFTAVTSQAFGLGSVGSDGTSTTVDIPEAVFFQGASDADVHSMTQYLATTYGVTSLGSN